MLISCHELCVLQGHLSRMGRARAPMQRDSAPRFDVYGVSFSPPRDSTPDYVAEHAPPFAVVKIDDARLRKLFRVKGVPMTLVLDPNGQIAYVHPSVIASAAQRDSIFAAAELVATVTAQAVSRTVETTALRPPKN